MKIACLSGKGGAGKTFVAVNLASVAGKCTYIDCDVEEPNGYIFWKPTDVTEQRVIKLMPTFDAQKCNGCKKCVDFCKFNALVYIKNKPMIFAEVCHSCGGCKLVCETEAITETAKGVGVVTTGECGEVKVVSGILDTGEASGVAVIKQALKNANGTTIIDCPPGSACSVMESIMDADFCVLVVEPTAFGFHNFTMVYELATLLGKRCGVVINKETEIYLLLEAFCAQNDITILDRIQYNPTLAQLIAKGEIASNCVAGERTRFKNILDKIGGLYE